MSNLKRVRLITRVLVAVLAMHAADAQDNVRIVANVDRDQAFVGQTIGYTISIRLPGEAPKPKIADVSGIEIRFNKQLSQEISSTFQFNNQIRRESYVQTQFDYTLILNKPGSYVIPAPVFEVDGEEHTGRERKITVLPVPKQSVVKLEADVTPASVYAMQPFTVNLKVTVQEIPGNEPQISPLNVIRNTMPHLQVPWLEEELPEHLTSSSPTEVLSALVNRRDGFALNNYVDTRNVFRQARLRFLPEFKKVKWTDEEGNEIAAREYTFARTFQSTRTGDFALGQAVLNGEFAAGEPLARQQIYTISNNVRVTINSPPLADRPPTWSGGVGSFHISSNITPRSADVGDPMTLEFVVRGVGTIDELVAPDLEQLGEITSRFRIYAPTEESFEDGRRFTWSVRPLNESVTELPAFEYSWFDPTAERYVVKSTEPIELVISKAAALSGTDIMGAAFPTGEELQVNRDGLFPNHTAVDRLRADGPGRTAWMASWCAMIAGYLGVSLGIQVHRRRNRDPAQIRRRKALSRAQESLSMISSAAATDRLSPDAVSRIVSGLIADFTGQPEAGMTSQDARRILSELGVTTEIMDRVAGLMEQCDAVRYGASVEKLSLARDCHAVITELGAELKARC